MIQLKKLKRLAFTKSCYVELPAEVTQRELQGYELEYRRQYAGIFHSRVGHLFFFELPHSQARNTFLDALEISYREMGVLVIRQTLFQD